MCIAARSAFPFTEKPAGGRAAGCLLYVQDSLLRHRYFCVKKKVYIVRRMTTQEARGGTTSDKNAKVCKTIALVH